MGVRAATLAVLVLAAGPAVAQERRHAPDRVLVQLAPQAELGASDAVLAAAFADLNVVATRPLREPSTPRVRSSFRRLGLDRIRRLDLAPGADVAAAVARLARTPGVVWAEPDFVDHALGTNVPNDPLFGQQYGFDQPSDADVDGPETWALTTGAPALVAVLDTGIHASHADLAGKIDPAGYDFENNDPNPADDHGHGTEVSSVAAASTDNGVGMAATCWLCSILPVKVLDENAEGTVFAFADGVVWAVDHGARVINYSAGGNQFTDTEMIAVNFAHEAGVPIVAAAGNGNVVALPARFGKVIAVGGSDENDALASFSSSGRAMDVIAPANNILTATLAGGYQLSDGTSFASPLVAGLAGLVDAVHPSVGVTELWELVRAGADDQVDDPSTDLPGSDSQHGSGRVNMERTLIEAQRSLGLRVEGKSATRVYYAAASTVAASYDFIRGDLAALGEGPSGVALGTTVCLENNSPDADTAGDEDLGMPAAGQAFFYLGRFNSGPWAGSYGGSSRHRDRLTPQAEHAADWIASETVFGSNFGTSVASAGDVNNDGYDDVIIGAVDKDTGSGNGAAAVYLGSATGLATTPHWTLSSTQLSSDLGASVAGIGDVNNDGYDDVAVGEPVYDGAVGNNEGRVHVYLGSATGLGNTAHRLLGPGQAQARFGTTVAPAGDVNNDGFDDMIVAAQRYDNGQLNEGRAYIYRGSALGLTIAPLWTFESNNVEAWLGSVGPAGDVNNDGFDDVIVGADRYTSGVERGRAWVFHGSASGPSTTPAVTLDSGGPSSRFGSWVYTAGDVDNDTFDDVLVTAQLYENGQVDEGAAFLYRGSASGVSSTPAWVRQSDQNEALLSVAATAGDVDQDGFDDVILGAFFMRRSVLDEGVAWLFRGSGTGLPATPAWTEYGLKAEATLGFSAARAGDVNNDGFDDVIVSAKGWDNGGWNDGRVLVYHGSATGLAPPIVLAGCDAIEP